MYKITLYVVDSNDELNNIYNTNMDDIVDIFIDNECISIFDISCKGKCEEIDIDDNHNIIRGYKFEEFERYFNEQRKKTKENGVKNG